MIAYLLCFIKSHLGSHQGQEDSSFVAAELHIAAFGCAGLGAQLGCVVLAPDSYLQGIDPVVPLSCVGMAARVQRN